MASVCTGSLPVLGDTDEESREAHGTLGSPKTGPVILQSRFSYARGTEGQDLLGVAVELPTFVHAKNQIDFFAGPEGLVQNALVVFLCRPKSRLQTKIEIILSNSQQGRERGK